MRVTECAQHAVRHAPGEAGRLGRDRVDTEHLLLALLRDPECLASAALGEQGAEVEAVRRRVEEAIGPGLVAGRPGAGGERAVRPLPMTKPVTLVLGLAAREARELEQDRVGTEHLLLGLAGEGDGGAAHLLAGVRAGRLPL